MQCILQATRGRTMGERAAVSVRPFFARRRGGRFFSGCGRLLHRLCSFLGGRSLDGVGRLVGQIITLSYCKQSGGNVGNLLHGVSATLVTAARVKLGHASIVTLLLCHPIVGGVVALSRIGAAFSTSIALVVDHLLGASSLCTHGATISSRGFRGLLFSFTRSMHIVLVVVTSHLYLVHLNGRLGGSRSQGQLTARISCLCTPLTRHLNLCAVGDRLRSLSLGCASHGRCSFVGRGLGRAGHSHSTCVTRFVAPVGDGLRRTKLQFSVGKHAGSVRSVGGGLGGRGVPFRSVCSLFTVHVVLSAPCRGRHSSY